MKSSIFHIKSEIELDRFTRYVKKQFADLRVLALYGGLGSGKTTFVKHFCKEFQLSSPVNSPTYSLVHEYEGKNCLVYHLDLYRIQSIEEALQIGVEDYIYSNHYCFIEWPELLDPILPKDVLKIRFEIVGESNRNIILL